MDVVVDHDHVVAQAAIASVTDEDIEESSKRVTPKTSGVSIVHVSIPNQPVQVQSVIQSPQSVIHSATGNTVAREIESEDSVSSPPQAADDETRKRRELYRRPSYRKILNELATDSVDVEKDGSSSGGSQDEESQGTIAAVTLPSYQTAQGEIKVIPAQAIQLSGGLQTLTMTNASSGQAGTIVQYAQGDDGQLYVPEGSLQSGVQHSYLIRTSTGAQGVVMATAGSLQSAHQMAEESARKRELRLMKNREAARECRRKKKDYIKCLENRVAVLENQNKTLVEELKALKDLYCHKTDI